MLIFILIVLLLVGLAIYLFLLIYRSRARRRLLVNVRDRYRPQYLLVGESKSGKTSLLESNGLDGFVTERFEKNRRLNRHFFDDGVVIDIAGDYVLRADGTANHHGWKKILRGLQKHRPQRPLDGLIITIPSTDLSVAHAFDQNELQEKADSLYRKLRQVQRILGMRLPVYILITKCDQISGFTSFAQRLPSRLHSQMFGWSNPSSSDTAYDPELLTDAFERLQEQLSELQFEFMQKATKYRM